MRRPVSRLFPSLVLLGFAALSALISCGAWHACQSAPSEKTWRKVPARVLGSGIEVDARSDTPFTAWVEYSYEHQEEIGGAVEGVGHTYTSRQVRQGGLTGSDYTDLWLKIRAYSAGAQVPAFLNPSNPADAVLILDAFGQVALIVATAVASLLCLAGVVALWKPRAPSSSGQGLAGRMVLCGFFGLFLAAGIATAKYFVGPILRVGLTASWVETPCVVIYSEVRHSVSHNDGEISHTYRPDILFEYVVDGIAYRSNRYYPIRFSSSGQKGKQAVVSENPPGHSAVCYVNSAEPWEAHFTKGLGLLWLWVLFPIPFLLIGGVGLWRCLRNPGRVKSFEPASRASSLQPDPSTYAVPEPVRAEPVPRLPRDESPVALPPSKGRGCGFLALLVASVFWNSVVLIFFLFDSAGGFGLMGNLFLLPFALIGILLLVGCFAALLNLFNARFDLELSRGFARPGEELVIQWRMRPGTLAPAPVKVAVKVRAEKTVITGSGKHRRSRTEVLWEGIAAEVADRYDLQQGQGVCRLPEGLNGVTAWKIRVEADVPGWPDLTDDFPLRVPDGTSS